MLIRVRNRGNLVPKIYEGGHENDRHSYDNVYNVYIDYASPALIVLDIIQPRVPVVEMSTARPPCYGLWRESIVLRCI